MKDQANQLDRMIDRALRETPLDPAPASLLPAILSQIEKPAPAAHYRFSWMDLAFSSILSLIAGYSLNFLAGAFRSPYWSIRLQIGFVLFWQRLRLAFLQHQGDILAGLISGLTVLTLVMILVGIYRRYTHDVPLSPAEAQA